MTDTALTLTVNGTQQTAPPGSTLVDLLGQLGRDPDQPGVAVAVGDRVIRRAEWPETALADGDRVEIITAAQGG